MRLKLVLDQWSVAGSEEFPNIEAVPELHGGRCRVIHSAGSAANAEIVK